MRLQLEPELSFDEAESSIRAVIERLREKDADAVLAKAWHCLAWIPWLRGEGAVAQQALDQAFAYAQCAGDTRTEAQILNFLVGVTLFGPTRVAVAIERCSAVLREARGEGRVAASALRALAGLHAMEGRFEEAWACVERDRAILRDLGLKVVVSSSTELAAIVGLLAGDPVRRSRICAGDARSSRRWATAAPCRATRRCSPRRCSRRAATRRRSS